MHAMHSRHFNAEPSHFAMWMLTPVLHIFCCSHTISQPCATLWARMRAMNYPSDCGIGNPLVAHLLRLQGVAQKCEKITNCFSAANCQTPVLLYCTVINRGAFAGNLHVSGTGQPQPSTALWSATAWCRVHGTWCMVNSTPPPSTLFFSQVLLSVLHPIKCWVVPLKVWASVVD